VSEREIEKEQKNAHYSLFHHQINPDKMEAGRNLQLNSLELTLWCHKFLGQITRSEHLLPMQIVEVLKCVIGLVENKFPNSVFIGYGNFMFLRFISPAIISPEAHGLTNGKRNNNRKKGRGGGREK
jgi:neurofibromin 1